MKFHRIRIKHGVASSMRTPHLKTIKTLIMANHKSSDGKEKKSAKKKAQGVVDISTKPVLPANNAYNTDAAGHQFKGVSGVPRQAWERGESIQHKKK